MRRGNRGSNHRDTPEVGQDPRSPDPRRRELRSPAGRSLDPRNPDQDSHNLDPHSPDSDPHSPDSRSLDSRSPDPPGLQLGHVRTVQPTNLFPIVLRPLRFAFDSSLEHRPYRTATPIQEAIGLPNYMAIKIVISFG